MNWISVKERLPEWEFNIFLKVDSETFSCEDCGSNMFSKSLNKDNTKSEKVRFINY
jgi:predicted  nucleic acid-binding Zn-ribbon protein